ncbi:family 16 glycosylhydrolase [Nocardioides sp. MH1]|uniref:glycoside hydrolase family 16 protein n=1 Tax=Nocardioides sp. MH1 TaxID=3242490 RepID=UPI00351FA73E
MVRSAVAVRRLLVSLVLVGAAGLAVPATAPASQPSYDGSAARTRTDRCGALIPKSGGGTWHCTFVDNFNGRAVDGDRWVVQRTSHTGFRTERTCYTDSPDNLAVHDGALVLSARKGRWVNCRFMGRWLRTRFTGGMIGTRDRYSQTYGRFEVRARFPGNEHAGIHGGFWMYPVDDTYGDWPSSGEIDVAEWWSYEPQLVLPSLHFDGRDPDVDSGWDCTVEDASVFHTYTVVWRPTVMQFAIDGTTCFTRTWTPDAPQRRPQPFDHPFRMILNLGVSTNGLSWRTEFPASLVVDYAKSWR